jgi:SAM-dependent methyltransferase
MVKGVLTWVPILNEWRRRRASTGGSDSPRYCYSVWLRHLVLLDRYGFKVSGARVGELGPGDSIGMGLAAIMSGATQYVGLDIVPFSAAANLEHMLDELARLYADRTRIPGPDEFPRVRPALESYQFPGHLFEVTGCTTRAAALREELRALRAGRNGSLIRYQAPWTSALDLSPQSLDVIVSQAVLEHVDDLDTAYRAMYEWLKPHGYASHVIDFTAHYLSPFWNGHWSYSDWQWKCVRGRREFLLNRAPLGAHLHCAKSAGFDILGVERMSGYDGLPKDRLARRFASLDGEDIQTRGVVLVLQKPRSRASDAGPSSRSTSLAAIYN